MDYLTEERRLLEQSARDFAMNEVLPIANKLDPERGEIPLSIRNKLAELGYFGIMIPEEYGGLGLGAFEYCLVTEELARAWMSVGTIVRMASSIRLCR
jgi:alkylation response protein AidB-like acyl-CoA dehydrogenase